MIIADVKADVLIKTDFPVYHFLVPFFTGKLLTKSSLSLEAVPTSEEQLPVNGTESHAATEKPLSDEYAPSAPMTTPMPSTFAGKVSLRVTWEVWEYEERSRSFPDAVCDWVTKQ